MKTVVVIGGGASGLMAGCIASQNKKNNVILIEKNEKLGKKIYITGKGRCNLSNYCSVTDFSSNIVNNSKFALHSLYSFSPLDTFNFFENNGLKLKIERGNRVFPVSEKASDVTKTLEKILHKNNVKTYLNTKVTDIFFSNDKITGVEINNKDFIGCDSIIICTGGISYPATGSTGDGYIFAEKASHTITPTRPALCGIELKGNDFLSLQGLSLKNVRLTVKLNGNVVFNEFGEMLFTHFGISGPIVLSCSSIINKYTGEKLIAEIDLKPALSYETLDNRLIRELTENSTKNISNVMKNLVPSSLVQLLLSRSKVNKDKKCCEITKENRNSLASSLKCLLFEIKKLRPIEEAIVTSGGVKVKDINPKTMESKKISGLFFAGEVLDVDCLTGGFNLQFAFSSGYLAGKNA